RNFPDDMAMDDVHSTVDSIYSQSLAANPPGVPKPQVDMKGSALAQAVYGPPQSDESENLRAAGYPGPSSEHLAAGPSSAAMGLAGAGGAVLAGAPIVKPLSALYGKALAKYPKTTMLATSEAITQARKIPYAGKLIPPMAEILPFLAGGKSSPAAEEEPTSPTNSKGGRGGVEGGSTTESAT